MALAMYAGDHGGRGPAGQYYGVDVFGKPGVISGAEGWITSTRKGSVVIAIGSESPASSALTRVRSRGSPAVSCSKLTRRLTASLLAVERMFTEDPPGLNA